MNPLTLESDFTKHTQHRILSEYDDI